MFLPSLLLLGNSLAFAPAPQPRLDLPEAEGQAEWYQQKAARTDLYGDPLPEGAMARIGTARFRFGNTALGIAYSPDGRTLAVAGHEGIDLLDASSGKTLARFTAPNSGGFDQAAFLAGGRYLATHSHANRILFWKLTPGPNRPLRGPETDRATQFVLSNDGKHLVFIKDRKIRLWDIKKGEEVVQLPRAEPAYRLSLSSDGKLLASMGGGTVTLWDLPSRKPLRQIPPAEEGEDRKPAGRPRDPVMTQHALSPDGKLLAGFMRAISGKHVVRLWETTTGKELRVLQVIDHTTRSMAFSSDGHFLALASQNHVQVWDVRSGQTRWHTPMYGNQFFSICFSPDGQFVATGLGSIVKVWETASGRERCPLPELREVRYFSLSPDGRTVLTSEQLGRGAADSYETSREEADIRYWDAASGNRLLSPQGQKKHFPPFAALSGDQRTLASWGPEKALQVWDLDSGKKLCQVSCEDHPDARVFSDDGKLLVLGSRGQGLRGKDASSRLVLWDARIGKRLGEFKGHRSFFIDVGFSPDGKVLASIDGDYRLHLWEAATQKELHQFKPKSQIYHLAFSRDSRMVAIAGRAPEVVFVEVSSGKELPKMPTAELTKKHSSGISALLLSPNGKRLITAGNNGKVFVWERETGRLVKEWQCGVSRMALSADGKVLLTQGGFTTLIWDLGVLLTKD